MHKLGFDGIIAYLGGNFTMPLLENATSIGMGVVPVNFSRAPGWIPTAELGEQDATSSTAKLAALGVPTDGLVDWCDLEGAGADPTAYLNAWSNVVSSDGRLSGLYVGSGCVLSGPELYALPKFTRYWRSLSLVPEPACGFCMTQLYPTTTFAGVSVDVDFACKDFENRSATWIIRKDIPTAGSLPLPFRSGSVPPTA